MNESVIHPTAIIDPSAELGAGVKIGPYCIIGPGVSLGDGCELQHHVTICGPSKIGPRNRFFAYGSIGQQTQDLKYAGEPTYLEIGEGNCFREFVSIHRGTAIGSYTRVGSFGNFLAYSHIAHDCVVGDHVIFSNNGTLAGHVIVEDHAVIGGLSGVHQFCRIGQHAIIGGCTKIVQDVPPFMIVDGSPATVRTINKINLERHGFTPERVDRVKQIYRILYREGLNRTQGLEKLAAHPDAATPEFQQMLAFAAKSERGLCPGN